MELNIIQNADCFEWIKDIEDKSVDLVLIDPPYEIAEKRQLEGGVESLRLNYDFGEWDYNFKGLDIIIKECYRVLKPSGTFICFYDLYKITNLKKYIEDANFSQVRFIEWVKTNPVPINSKYNYLTNAREIALTAVKGGKSIFNSEYDNGIYSFPINHEEGRFHPTQKPVKLIEALILKHTNTNMTVLDCFMGSGTTAIGCQNTNRNFIGCEISKEYYDKAVLRIKQNQKPQRLF